MPSYADHFPIRIEPRPLRFDSSQTDPAELAREELKRILGEHRGVLDRLLVSIAQAAFQLRQIHAELASQADQSASHGADGVDIVAANLEQVLEENGVRMNDLTGSPWNTQMSAEIEIRAHSVREGIAEPTVVHMELPVVRQGDRLLAKGAAIIEAPKRT